MYKVNSIGYSGAVYTNTRRPLMSDTSPYQTPRPSIVPSHGKGRLTPFRPGESGNRLGRWAPPRKPKTLRQGKLWALLLSKLLSKCGGHRQLAENALVSMLITGKPMEPVPQAYVCCACSGPLRGDELPVHGAKGAVTGWAHQRCHTAAVARVVAAARADLAIALAPKPPRKSSPIQP